MRISILQYWQTHLNQHNEISTLVNEKNIENLLFPKLKFTYFFTEIKGIEKKNKKKLKLKKKSMENFLAISENTILSLTGTTY